MGNPNPKESMPNKISGIRSFDLESDVLIIFLTRVREQKLLRKFRHGIESFDEPKVPRLRAFPSPLPGWHGWYLRISAANRSFCEEIGIGHCISLSLADPYKNQVPYDNLTPWLACTIGSIDIDAWWGEWALHLFNRHLTTFYEHQHPDNVDDSSLGMAWMLRK
ncbi:hypothetical protein GUJ93_ZPchr0006g41587 [Zizania palustris]|uniref:Uncharacterized protein n=1 Tax=Zizania palustris TaxID=103762 RepID=A0A8J5VXK2_ZIZPA|nr:hypothetical protein GUJ93_ZPchr0006g41587 [Zizania palustris]KAG8077027.1 hypothetical protein GUJ93_ZPchr0006g41587 [Zizania palustris]